VYLQIILEVLTFPRVLDNQIIEYFSKEEYTEEAAMEQTVLVDQKDFIGIGKIVFDSNAKWNIPHLHFMVDKTASGNYEATSLEFGLVSWSELEKEAITSLVKQTYFYILSVMEKSSFDQFIKEVDNHVYG
jgi:hypothetical protein